MHEKSALIFAQWVAPEEVIAGSVHFVRDGATLPVSLQHLNIVLDSGTEVRASELLERGAARVLLADAALLDSTAVSRLSQKYGSARIGVALRATKRHVTWTLDTVSNEDFNCVTPSYGKAGFEIVLSDGTTTGTDVEWWLVQMMELGASTALICADIQDDDLNTCAGLVETHGNKIWFSPWQQPDADLEPWVRYGQMRQLLLPAPNTRDEIEMARIRIAAMTDQEIALAEKVKAAGEAVPV
jgi:hypothetical protein